MQCWKLFHGKCSIERVLPGTSVSDNRGHRFKVSHTRAAIDVRKRAFAARCVGSRNALSGCCCVRRKPKLITNAGRWSRWLVMPRANIRRRQCKSSVWLNGDVLIRRHGSVYSRVWKVVRISYADFLFFAPLFSKLIQKEQGTSASELNRWDVSWANTWYVFLRCLLDVFLLCCCSKLSNVYHMFIVLENAHYHVWNTYILMKCVWKTLFWMNLS